MSRLQSTNVTVRLMAILLFSTAGFTANAQYAEPQLQRDSTVIRERNNGVYVSAIYYIIGGSARLDYERKLSTEQGRKYTRSYYARTSAGRSISWEHQGHFVVSGVTCAFQGSRRLQREIGMNIIVVRNTTYGDGGPTTGVGIGFWPTIGYRYHTKYGLSYRFGLFDGGFPVYYSVGYAF